MPTATITLNGTVTGMTSGSKAITATWTDADALPNVHTQTLTQGASNTITVPTVPTAAKGVLIVPPTTTTETVTLKGIAGDTGIVIASAEPTFLVFSAAPPASFVITLGAGTNRVFEFSYF